MSTPKARWGDSCRPIRHCEPTGRANARPMTGSAKQSIEPQGKSGLLRRLRGVVAGDCLYLEIFFQAVFAPLAAVAGLLVATERRGAVVRHALQVDVPRADPAADLAGGLHGVGGDVTGEAIRAVVGDPDRVVLILGAQNGEHRAKDF